MVKQKVTFARNRVRLKTSPSCFTISEEMYEPNPKPGKVCSLLSETR